MPPPRFHASIKSLTDETGVEKVTALATNSEGTYVVSVTESFDAPNYASLLSSHDCYRLSSSTEDVRPKIPSGAAGVTAVAVYSRTSSNDSSGVVWVACGYDNGHVDIFENGSRLVGSSRVSISEYDDGDIHRSCTVLALKFLPTSPSDDSSSSLMMRLVAVTKAGELVLLDATRCLNRTVTTVTNTNTNTTVNTNTNTTVNTNTTPSTEHTRLLENEMVPPKEYNWMEDGEKEEEEEKEVVTLSLLSLIRLPSHAHKPTEVPLANSLAVGGTNYLSNGYTSPFVAVGMSEGSVILLADQLTHEKTMDLTVLETIVLPSGPTSLAFSNNQVTLLAVGLQDGEVAFMDASSSSCCPLPSFEIFYFLKSLTKKAVSAVAFSPSSCILAVASESTLYVMDGSTFEIFYRHSTRNRSTITSLAYMGGDSNNSKLILSRKDGVTSLINMRCWDQLLGDALHTPHTIHHLTFASERRMAVASGSDLLLYETQAWSNPKTMSYSVQPTHTLSLSDTVLKTAYSPDATLIAAASHDTENHHYTITLFSLPTNTNQADPQIHKQTLSNMTSKVTVICFSPCSQYLMVGTTTGLAIYDLTKHSDAVFDNEDSIVFQKEDESVLCACWASDESMIAVGYTEEVILYSVQNNNQDDIDLQEIETLAVDGSDVAFDTECTTLAIGRRSGTIVIVKKDAHDDIDGWYRQYDEVAHRGTVTSLQFSTDLPSSFLITTGSNNSCQVYSCKGKRFLLVQDIESSVFDKINCFSIDPAGSTLVMGGKSSIYGKERGAIMAVRVGELLRVDWFPLAFAHSDRKSFTPQLACQKLSELEAIDRAQLLYHRPLDIHADVSFMMEKAIQRFLTKRSKDSMTCTLGSDQIKSINHTIEIMHHLRAILETFPISVFATTSRFGTSIFDVAVRRKDPSLLQLLLKTALSSCKAYPYVLMNESLRGGHITNILIQAMPLFPQQMADVILHNLEWWPSISMNSKKSFYLQGKSIKYQPHTSPDAKHLFHEHTNSDNEGALALPMLFPIPDIATIQFLSAVTYHCPLIVFSKVELKILIHHLWSTQIRKVFLLDFIFYSLYVFIWGSFLTMKLKSVDSFDKDMGTKTSVLGGLVFAFNIINGVEGLLEYISSPEYEAYRKSIESPWVKFSFSSRRSVSKHKVLLSDFCKFCFSKYLKSEWELVSCLSWWMVNITILFHWLELPTFFEIAAITTILIVIEFNSYLRGFNKTAWALKVLHCQFQASLGFFLIIGVVVIGVSLIFQILVGPYSDHFRDYGNACWHTLDIAINGRGENWDLVDTTYMSHVNVFILTILSVFLFIGAFVVALNGYIALLIDAYNYLKKHQDAHLSQEKARMVLKYMGMYPKSRIERISASMKYFLCLVHMEHQQQSENVQDILANLQKQDEKHLSASITVYSKRSTSSSHF